MEKYSGIIKDLIPKKKILRGLKNASYLTIGHFLSLIINFVGFIYIARLLGPSEYGIYVMVGAFVGLFVILTFQGVKKVVLREGAKDLSTMSYYLEKTAGIKFLFTFIAICLCIICSFFAPYMLREKIYIILFSFTLIFKSFHGFFGTVYQAAEKMQYNAALNIFNRILLVSISIAFLYMGFGLFALFCIILFSDFLTLIINFRLTKKFLVFKLWSKIKWDGALLKPALIFSILSFTVLLTTKIDLVMISWLGSSEDVGIYGVAYQIIYIGTGLRNLLGTAFFPIFVQTFHKNAIKWKKLLTYAFLLGLGLLLFASVVSVFSEQFIILLLGGVYAESGVILSVLIFHLALIFCTLPFTNTLQATHNESKLLKICWVAPGLNIVLNYLFFNMFGLIGIAYSTLVVGSVILPIYVIITWRALKIQNKLK